MKDDQRVALTRRLLMEGLLRLLETKDIDHISVSQLCSESGINRATFYRHYGQPRDILQDLRRSISRDVEALTLRAQPEKHAMEWLEELCRYFQEHAPLLRILFKTRTDDEFVHFIQELYSRQFARLRAGFAPEQDADSLKLTAYCFAGGFYYILRQWLMEPVDKTPQEVAAVLHRFLFGR